MYFGRFSLISPGNDAAKIIAGPDQSAARARPVYWLAAPPAGIDRADDASCEKAPMMICSSSRARSSAPQLSQRIVAAEYRDQAAHAPPRCFADR